MYKEAIDSYENCIKQNPLGSDAYVKKGFCLIEMRQFDEAIAWFSQSILVEPQHKYLAYFTKAKYIYQESNVKDFVEAISCLNEAIKMKPDCAELFHFKGLCLFEL